jgi:hypothetical protein
VLLALLLPTPATPCGSSCWHHRRRRAELHDRLPRLFGDVLISDRRWYLHKTPGTSRQQAAGGRQQKQKMIARQEEKRRDIAVECSRL